VYAMTMPSNSGTGRALPMRPRISWPGARTPSARPRASTTRGSMPVAGTDARAAGLLSCAATALLWPDRQVERSGRVHDRPRRPDCEARRCSGAPRQCHALLDRDQSRRRRCAQRVEIVPLAFGKRSQPPASILRVRPPRGASKRTGLIGRPMAHPTATNILRIAIGVARSLGTAHLPPWCAGRVIRRRPRERAPPTAPIRPRELELPPSQQRRPLLIAG
jgi:hypothetical protein